MTERPCRTEEDQRKFDALRARIDAADAAYERGEFRKSTDAAAMKADMIARGMERLRHKA
jgi:hypothetical protein